MKKAKLVVDGHVHIYRCYDFEKFFSMAIRNLQKIFFSLYAEDNCFYKIILLTEGGKNDYFSRFKKNGRCGKKSEYGFVKTMEDSSLIVIKKDLPQCWIISGRQIITKENIEVLSIASKINIEDGLPIEEVIQRIVSNQEIAVLPWGFGKWFFKRGEIIRHIIEEYHSPYLFIGDNSSRPSFLSRPSLYCLAEKFNVGIISGSDPLPFNGEEDRVGTYGFIIEGDFQANKPAEHFCNMLITDNKNIYLSGSQDNALLFLKRQTKMILKNYGKFIDRHQS